MQDRKRIIDAVRAKLIEKAKTFADMEYEETGYGRPEDKFTKNLGTAESIPGIESISTDIFSANDEGMVFDFYSSFGVIGALTPVTNPSTTITGNGLMFGIGFFTCSMAQSVIYLILGYGICLGLGLSLVYGNTIGTRVKFFPTSVALPVVWRLLSTASAR